MVLCKFVTGGRGFVDLLRPAEQLPGRRTAAADTQSNQNTTCETPQPAEAAGVHK